MSRCVGETSPDLPTHDESLTPGHRSVMKANPTPSNPLRNAIHHFPWKAFGLLLLVLYFGHWLGATVHALVDRVSGEFPHHHPWLMAMAGGLVLTVLVVILHYIHHRHPRQKSIPFRTGTWTLSTLAVIFAYCAATWTEHAVLGIEWLKNNPTLFVILCALGLLAVNRVLRDILRGIEGPRNIHQTGYPAEAPQTLILLVSLVSRDTLEFPDTGPFAIVRTGPPGRPPVEYELSGADLAADIAALDKSKWPWQQLMRAIRPHPNIQKIILIGSATGLQKGTPGSFTLLDHCKSLLSRYVPLDREIVVAHPEAVPFEDFNAIKETLRALVVEEARVHGDGRVAIDVTGGQATTSIAAAAATIGTEAIFQYVQTNVPYEVLYYDVHNVHPPDPHGH